MEIKDNKKMWRFIVINTKTNEILAFQKKSGTYKQSWNNYYSAISCGTLVHKLHKNIEVKVISDDEFNKLLKLKVNKNLTK